MARPDTTHSHLICPTCWSDISTKDLKDLVYFASTGSPRNNDDIMNRYEEVSRLVSFLGALAEAGPKAVAQTEQPIDEWVMYLSWLAQELAGETERRLLLLREAADIWERRAKQGPAGKEG